MGQGYFLEGRGQRAEGRRESRDKIDRLRSRGFFFCALPSALCALFLACAKTPTPEPMPRVQPKAEAAAPAPVDRTTQARNALALFDAKNYDEAVPALTEATRAYPEIAPFLRLRIVEAEIARGNF